jgi:predicted nuclease of predicted toxin-antitoxin system
MRILLDECMNPRVRTAFADHQVKTVVEMGWSGITNGKLLSLAEKDFDVFVTLDQNLEYQQNTQRSRLGFLVVKVPDNKISRYEPIFADMRAAVERLQPGQIIHIAASTPPRPPR